MDSLRFPAFVDGIRISAYGIDWIECVQFGICVLTSSNPSPENIPVKPSGTMGSCKAPEPSLNAFNASVRLSVIWFSCGGAVSSIPWIANAAASAKEYTYDWQALVAASPATSEIHFTLTGHFLERHIDLIGWWCIFGATKHRRHAFLEHFCLLPKIVTIAKFKIDFWYSVKETLFAYEMNSSFQTSAPASGSVVAAVAAAAAVFPPLFVAFPLSKSSSAPENRYKVRY